MHNEHPSFWRVKKVSEQIGLSPSMVKLYAKTRADFPRSITLGTGQKRARAVVWVSTEILAWQKAKIMERDEKLALAHQAQHQ